MHVKHSWLLGCEPSRAGVLRLIELRMILLKHALLVLTVLFSPSGLISFL